MEARVGVRDRNIPLTFELIMQLRITIFCMRVVHVDRPVGWGGSVGADEPPALRPRSATHEQRPRTSRAAPSLPRTSTRDMHSYTVYATRK